MKPSQLIGRQTERAWLEQALADRPGPLQIVGPAGIGKSMLVRAVVGAGLPWLNLEPVAPGSLLAHLAGELECLATEASVLAALERGEGCVLDGAENHHQALGPLLHALQGREAPAVVVTSQLRLGPWPTLEVGPLSQREAEELFLQRGRESVNAELEHSAAVAELVERLDCWPLAIELAASRLRLYAPAEMLEVDVLQVLSDRHRPGRHTSVEAALSTTWQLLSEAEQRALAQTALICHPFGRSVFKAVTGAGLEVLERLLDASLVVWETRGGRRRYRLLNAVRAFARARLQEDDPAIHRYAEMVLERARRAEARVRGPEGRGAYDVLRLISADLRAIAVLDDAGQAGEAAHALATLALVQGPLDDGLALVDGAIARLPTTALQVCRCELLIGLGREEEALKTALELRPTPVALRLRGRASLRVDLEGAQGWFEQARDGADSEGDVVTAAASRAALGVARRRMGDNRGAMRFYEEALQLARQHGLTGTEAAVLANKTLIEMDWYGASETMAEALAHAAQLALAQGHLRRHAQVFVLQARTAVERGSADAEQLILEAREIVYRVGDTARLRMLDSIEAFWLLEHGRPEAARSKVGDDGSSALHRAQRDSLRGYLAWAEGQTREAARWFETATEGWATVGLERERLLSDLNLATLRGEAPPELDLRAWPENSPMWIAHRITAVLASGRVPSKQLVEAARVSIECRLLTDFGVAERPVVVAEDGTWFTCDQGRIDLSRRRVLTRILAALAKRAGEPVPLETLVEEGWPGQTLAGDSGRTRVHVAIADLRRQGLREALQTVDGDYVLTAQTG